MGHRVSAISESRARIAQSLRDDAVLPGWRIHDVSPANLVTPAAWVDMPSLDRRELTGRGATTVVVTWSVMLVVDGRDDAQMAALDEGLARLWDAVDKLPRVDCISVAAQPFDVGGPRNRGVVLTVEETIIARTLCPPARMSELQPTP